LADELGDEPGGIVVGRKLREGCDLVERVFPAVRDDHPDWSRSQQETVAAVVAGNLVD
jgi:hypothetical protein